MVDPRRAALTWAALSCLAAGRVAAEPPTSRPSGYETVVRGEGVRKRAPADDPTGFTTVLELPRTRGGVELSQILARVPGVKVKDHGPGQRQTLALRGAESHQVAVVLDGVRLNAPGRGGVDLQLFDPALLERVEVRRSAGSTRFGSGALGGALVLQTPRLRRRRRTRFSVGYGSWNTFKAHASHGGSVGRLRYLTGAAYRQSDGDFSFVDDNGVARVRANNDTRLAELLVKVDHMTSARWQLAALTDLAAAFRGAPGLSQRPSTTARQRHLRGLLALSARRLDLLVPGDALTLQLEQRYGHFSFDEPAPPPVRSQNHDLTLAGTARGTLPLRGKSRLDLRLELRQELFFDDDVGDQQRFVVDLAASSVLELFSRRVVAVPAVRLASATGFGATVAPKLGLLAAPFTASRGATRWLAGLQVVGNVGRSLRYPSFQELYIRIDGFGGNPELQLEDALSADVGLRWHDPGRWIALEAAYFRRWLKNIILFAPVSSFLVRPDNFSGVIAQGLESALELHPGWCVALAGAYTFTATRFGEPAAALPGHPKHALTARAGWSGRCTPSQRRTRRPLPGWLQGLALWTTVSWQGAMVLGRFDTLAEEARLLWSAGASYRYRWLTVALEGRNLLDVRDAVDSVGFPLPPARFFSSVTLAL